MSSSNLTSNPNRVEGSTYAEHEGIYSEWQRNMATIIEQVEDNERQRLREMWPDQDKTVAELSRTKRRNVELESEIVEFAETVQKLQKALAFSRMTCAENYDWWKTAESNVYPLKHRIAELEGENAKLRQQLAEKPNPEAKSA